VSAVLLVRLKITDLAAWTALEAGRRLLPPEGALTRILREQLYLFEPEPGDLFVPLDQLRELSA